MDHGNNIFRGGHIISHVNWRLEGIVLQLGHGEDAYGSPPDKLKIKGERREKIVDKKLMGV
jgi:hypothetical protein